MDLSKCKCIYVYLQLLRTICTYITWQVHTMHVCLGVRQNRSILAGQVQMASRHGTGAHILPRYLGLRDSKPYSIPVDTQKTPILGGLLAALPRADLIQNGDSEMNPCKLRRFFPPATDLSRKRKRSQSNKKKNQNPIACSGLTLACLMKFNRFNRTAEKPHHNPPATSNHAVLAAFPIRFSAVQ